MNSAGAEPGASFSFQPPTVIGPAHHDYCRGDSKRLVPLHLIASSWILLSSHQHA